MNFESKTWVAVTVIVALITMGLVYNYLKGFQEETGEFKEVVAAVVKIDEGTKLTSEMVKTVNMPAKYIHAQAVTDAKDVVGMYTSVDLWADEIILKQQVASTDNSSEMPYRIAEGMRAITIGIDAVSGVAGHVKPGHRVDVLMNATVNEVDQTFTLLQNIEVLAVGTQLTKKEGAQETASITLAVNPDQAQRVMLAESEGDMKVVLRGSEDEQTVNNGKIDINWLSAQY